MCENYLKFLAGEPHIMESLHGSQMLPCTSWSSFLSSFPFNLLPILNNSYLGLRMNGAHSDASKRLFRKENYWGAQESRERPGWSNQHPLHPLLYLTPFHITHPVQFPLSEEMKQNTSTEWTGLFLRVIKLQLLIKGVENELLFHVSEALRQTINILVPW